MPATQCGVEGCSRIVSKSQSSQGDPSGLYCVAAWAGGGRDTGKRVRGKVPFKVPF